MRIGYGCNRWSSGRIKEGKGAGWQEEKRGGAGWPACEALGGGGQGSLEAYSRVLFGHLDGEVWALRQRKADYGEARRLSDGSGSCWSNTGSGSDSAAEIEVGIEPLALEGVMVAVIQGGEGEGTTGELAGKREGKNELAQQPVRHPFVQIIFIEKIN